MVLLSRILRGGRIGRQDLTRAGHEGTKGFTFTNMAILTPRNGRPVQPIKTPREEAKYRVLASYRRKITRLFPSAKFDESFVLECTADEFMDELQAKFRDGMTWENYGTLWCVANYEKLDVKFLLSNVDAFYSHFSHHSFEPKLLTEIGGRLGNLYRKEKPKGFTANPGQPNPYDRVPED